MSYPSWLVRCAIRRLTAAVLVACAAPTLCAFDSADLTLPAGYAISVYASDVPNARQMAVSPGGTVFVGSREQGSVYAVVDTDGDYHADQVFVIARDLNMPSGVAYRDGSLYVAEINRIVRFDDIEQKLAHPGEPIVVTAALPTERHHGWKFIRFGPDGRLYVPVGAPCNVCDVEPPFATILSMNSDGAEWRMHARGVRNSVGFDWHPLTGQLWFSDNGRDALGDDVPPGEINRIDSPGAHFGFPFIHGGVLPDPEFGRDQDAADYVGPRISLDAHVAPLGIEFYRGDMFPCGVGECLFVAEHGSWNRSLKSGYRVMRARLGSDGEVSSYEVFISGWLRGQAHWGRPVDMEMLADGSLLVSDDYKGVIYRVVYSAGSNE